MLISRAAVYLKNKLTEKLALNPVIGYHLGCIMGYFSPHGNARGVMMSCQISQPWMINMWSEQRFFNKPKSGTPAAVL